MTLTRSISVEAQGEVAALKDNINEMIGTLAATTRQNNDQDWLKTNIARFTGMLQGQRDLLAVSKLLLSELAPLLGCAAWHVLSGGFCGRRSQGMLKMLAGYAFDDRDKRVTPTFKMGQGTDRTGRAGRSGAFW